MYKEAHLWFGPLKRLTYQMTPGLGKLNEHQQHFIKYILALKLMRDSIGESRYQILPRDTSSRGECFYAFQIMENVHSETYSH